MNRFILSSSRKIPEKRDGFVQARIIVFPFQGELTGVIASGGYTEGLSTLGPSKYAIKIYPDHTHFKYIPGSILARINETRALRDIGIINPIDSAAIQTLISVLRDEWGDIFFQIERVENRFLLKSELAGAEIITKAFDRLVHAGELREVLSVSGQLRITSEDLKRFTVFDGREKALPMLRYKHDI